MGCFALGLTHFAFISIGYGSSVLSIRLACLGDRPPSHCPSEHWRISWSSAHAVPSTLGVFTFMVTFASLSGAGHFVESHVLVHSMGSLPGPAFGIPCRCWVFDRCKLASLSGICFSIELVVMVVRLGALIAAGWVVFLGIMGHVACFHAY